jgi:predicted transglutaminase-like protease
MHVYIERQKQNIRNDLRKVEKYQFIKKFLLLKMNYKGMMVEKPTKT